MKHPDNSKAATCLWLVSERLRCRPLLRKEKPETGFWEEICFTGDKTVWLAKNKLREALVFERQMLQKIWFALVRNKEGSSGVAFSIPGVASGAPLLRFPGTGAVVFDHMAFCRGLLS